MKKMAIIHTSAVSLQDLTALCQEIMPEVEIINIIDDSLLAEVKRNTGITPAVISRMCRYVQSAESLGVDLIFNQCSSVGEAFAIASRCTAIPTLRVDEPMAEKGSESGCADRRNRDGGVDGKTQLRSDPDDCPTAGQGSGRAGISGGGSAGHSDERKGCG